MTGTAPPAAPTVTTTPAPPDQSGTQLGGVGGPGNRTGVSDTEVHIGVTGNFPSNIDATSDFLKAFRAYADEVNSAGGVHGRKVVFDIGDTGGTTTQGGVDAAKQVEGRVLYNCECQGTDNAIGAGQYLDERGVPHFMVTATEPIVASLRHGFVIVPTTEDFTRRTLEYMAGPLALRGKKLGLIRSNYAVWAPSEAVFKSYAKELDMSAAVIRVTEPTQASYVSELSAMRDAGVEGVMCFCSLEILGLVRDGNAIGYHPTYAGPTFTFDIIAQAGAGSLRGIRSVRLGGTVDQPGYAAYRDAVVRRYGEPVQSDAFIFWGQAQFLVEVLRIAGPDPTRERVEAAMATLRDFRAEGAVAPITFGPGDRIGTTSMLPVKCCNDQDQWISEGPYRESFR